MRLVRIIITYLVFPWLSPFLLLNTRLRNGFWQRFGFGIASPQNGGPHIWLHGASAGDILALVTTARSIRTHTPDAILTITAMTDSGFSVASRHKDLFNQVRYFPWDLPGSVRRTLQNLKPDAIVLEYAELWPELMHQARQAGVRLILHNGRFSRERFEGYHKLFRFTGNLVEQLDLLLMRDAAEQKRALALGAAPEKIHVTGNTKFDQLQTVQESRDNHAFKDSIHFQDDGAPILVAGSTHDGEEAILLDSLMRLRTKFPTLRLIIAPRYLEKLPKIQELVAQYDLKVSFRTQANPGWDVLILDTVGELSLAYALSTLVFVGGSINDRGGHNIIEPALYERPVIFGPYMSNVEDSVQILLGRGGLQVSGPEQLERILDELLSHPEQAQDLGLKAGAQARSVQGAAQRNTKAIMDLLS